MQEATDVKELVSYDPLLSVSDMIDVIRHVPINWLLILLSFEQENNTKTDNKTVAKRIFFMKCWDIKVIQAVNHFNNKTA